ncbi:hypothetical protein BH11BAC7_BH11BAC7_18260 [soil metagenome]
MKHLFLLLALCAGQLAAQPLISKVYGPGSSWQSEPQCMVLAADSGYFMAGGKGNPNGGGDGLIIRVNKNGDTLWTAGFGTPFPDGLAGIVATSDGGCAAVGTFNLSFQQQQNVTKPVVARYNAAGQVQWIKSYNPPGYSGSASTILELPNGDLIVLGSLLSSSSNYDAFIFRINSQGNLIWSNKYTLSSDHEGYNRARICADGNILAVGTLGGPSHPNAIALLTKIDPSGNVIWARRIVSPTSSLFGQDVALKADGGCVITGLCATGQSYEVFAMGFNSIGDTTFTAHYGSTVNSEWGHSIAPSRHGFILCGSTESFSPSIDAWLLEIDTVGQLLWSRAYGDGGWQEGWGAIQTPEGGFAVAAREEGAPGAYRFWFYKTDSAGVGGLCGEYPTATVQGFQPATSIVSTLNVVPAGVETVLNLPTWRGVPTFNSCILTSVEEENAAALTIFPNPAQDELRIANIANDAKVRVTDAMGKTVTLSSTINDRVILLNTSALAAGIYFVSVTNEDGELFSRKFVICR